MNLQKIDTTYLILCAMIQTALSSLVDLLCFYMPLGHNFPLKAHVDLWDKLGPQVYNVRETCAIVMQNEKSSLISKSTSF